MNLNRYGLNLFRYSGEGAGPTGDVLLGNRVKVNICAWPASSKMLRALPCGPLPSGVVQTRALLDGQGAPYRPATNY